MKLTRDRRLYEISDLQRTPSFLQFTRVASRFTRSAGGLWNRRPNGNHHERSSPHYCAGRMQPHDKCVSILSTLVPHGTDSKHTAILSAHWLGTSLGPSSKRYRLLADILNDIALILDTISPAFSTLSLSSLFPGIAGLLHATRLGPMDLGYLRYVALGLSASCRALCGVVAGGSKAAISLHFASPLEGTGDIGDLNAKDASKETVLALFGMLVSR